MEPPATKRGLLSVVARLFDPLGWLGPVLIRAKILIQHLWLQNYNWGCELDAATLADCVTFYQQLKDIGAITIPRCFGRSTHPCWYLYGFADASERAYAAVIYLVPKDLGTVELYSHPGQNQGGPGQEYQHPTTGVVRCRAAGQTHLYHRAQSEPASDQNLLQVGFHCNLGLAAGTTLQMTNLCGQLSELN